MRAKHIHESVPLKNKINLAFRYFILFTERKILRVETFELNTLYTYHFHLNTNKEYKKTHITQIKWNY